MNNIFTVVVGITSSTCLNFSPVTFVVWSIMLYFVHQVLSCCLILRALVWLAQGIAQRALDRLPLHWLALSDSVCLQVYHNFFLCVIQSVLMDEDTSQVSSFHYMMEEYMPCAPEREGTSRCILTAPSSTRNGCWVPPPYSHTRKRVFMHIWKCKLKPCKCQHSIQINENIDLLGKLSSSS